MIDQIVERYIQLRDTKAKRKAAYDADIATIDNAMDRIERHLLGKMQEQGLKSFPTAAGTAYIQHRTSVTVADWPNLLGFIKANDLWSMLEARVSKKAVEEFKVANADLPPGVNWSESIVVNVKRS